MSVYAIDAVRMNAKSGLVEQVRWGKVGHPRNHWEAEPAISDVTDLVEKILSGEEVWTVFPVGHFTVFGPKVGITISSHGKDIEVIDPDDHPGRTVGELPTF